MQFSERIEYVLANEIERRQCKECLGMWFLFNHYGRESFYRLAIDAPENCSTCKPIDEEIEARSVMSEEQWVSL